MAGRDAVLDRDILELEGHRAGPVAEREALAVAIEVPRRASTSLPPPSGH